MSTIYYLTRIEFGEGQAARLPEFLAALGIRKPLIATDKGLVATGLVGRIAASLASPRSSSTARPRYPPKRRDDGSCVYVAQAAMASWALAAARHWISQGGAAAHRHEGLVAIHAGRGGLSRIHGRICPMIARCRPRREPARRLGRAAVIITAEGRKLGIISPHMLPSFAVCDPELTYGLPPGLPRRPAWTPSHLLETLMAPAFNPPADAIAMDGLTRGWRAL